MSRVNIVKRIKIGGLWKMFSIPRNAKGNYDWNAIADVLLCRMVRGRHTSSGGCRGTSLPPRPKRRNAAKGMNSKGAIQAYPGLKKSWGNCQETCVAGGRQDVSGADRSAKKAQYSPEV